MMNPKARFGKGVYLAESKRLALREKHHAENVTHLQDSKFHKKNSLDVRRLSAHDMKSFSQDKDLRGNIHRGVPAGDLAKKVGREAGRNGRAIIYPPAQGKGADTFIPSTMYKQHPEIGRGGDVPLTLCRDRSIRAFVWAYGKTLKGKKSEKCQQNRGWRTNGRGND